jgi:hypothetical protein
MVAIMKRLLYTAGIAAALFHGYVIHSVVNAATETRPPEYVYLKDQSRMHIVNVPDFYTKSDPLYSALNKAPIFGPHQSSITWQQIFTAPSLAHTYTPAKKGVINDK